MLRGLVLAIATHPFQFLFAGVVAYHVVTDMLRFARRRSGERPSRHVGSRADGSERATLPVHVLAVVTFLGFCLVGTAMGEPPKPWTSNALPLYPRLAREDQAVVTLRVVVNDDGSVRDPRIIAGEEPFASAALDAVKRWRYEPAREAGLPVAVPRQILVRFEPPPKTADRWHVYRREPRPHTTPSVAAQ